MLCGCKAQTYIKAVTVFFKTRERECAYFLAQLTVVLKSHKTTFHTGIPFPACCIYYRPMAMLILISKPRPREGWHRRLGGLVDRGVGSEVLLSSDGHCPQLVSDQLRIWRLYIENSAVAWRHVQLQSEIKCLHCRLLYL